VSKDSVATAGDSFTVTGSGFAAGEPITLMLQVDESLQIILGGSLGAQVSANGAGAFSMTFDEIGRSLGLAAAVGDTVSLMANGGNGSRASAPVRLVSTPSSVASVDASLAAGAAVVGDSIAIWGAGFSSGEAVTLVVVGASAGSDRILVGATANDSGAFSIDSSNPLDAGVYTLKAMGASGTSATAPLVVLESK